MSTGLAGFGGRYGSSLMGAASPVFGVRGEYLQAIAWLAKHHPILYDEWRAYDQEFSNGNSMSRFEKWLSERDPEVFAMYDLVRSTRELSN